MSDFVEEVEEQLRAEQMASLASRLWPWFAAALVATVIAWAGLAIYQAVRDRDISRASVVYDRAIDALASGDQTGAYTDLDPVAKDGPAGYRSLALMTQADMRLGAGKADEAAALYDRAAKAAPNAIFRDLARLRAAQALMDTAPLAQTQARLAPLIGADRPFDLEAREALALAKLQAGKAQEARGDLNAISLTLGVSQAMRSRAQAIIALIDSGQAGLDGRVVTTAATLPPSAVANAERLLAGAAQPEAAGDGASPGTAAASGPGAGAAQGSGGPAPPPRSAPPRS